MEWRCGELSLVGQALTPHKHEMSHLEHLAPPCQASLAVLGVLLSSAVPSRALSWLLCARAQPGTAPPQLGAPHSLIEFHLLSFSAFMQQLSANCCTDQILISLKPLSNWSFSDSSPTKWIIFPCGWQELVLVFQGKVKPLLFYLWHWEQPCVFLGRQNLEGISLQESLCSSKKCGKALPLHFEGITLMCRTKCCRTELNFEILQAGGTVQYCL